jgi:hypothetical protein
VLDKVNARTRQLGVRVGQKASFGTLVITVRGCYVRPPDQRQDATAYLDINDPQQPDNGFDGWIFAAEPFVSMLEHPIYDVRLAGCRS